jgi:UDP-N-acetylmuramyl pentapeptide phosphotransferase/UDP-N-acetylglucosamine-1-phosphate transferase
LSNGGWAFLGAGLIAIVGYLDDAESVSVLQRLVAQFLVTSASIVWFALSSNASNELFSIVSVTVVGSLLVLLWIWFINLL